MIETTETKTMTPEERLYADMETKVDPKTFNGHDPCGCLIGQLGESGNGMITVSDVTKRYGVAYEVVLDIYFGVMSDWHAHSYKRSLALARRVLGIKVAKR